MIRAVAIIIVGSKIFPISSDSWIAVSELVIVITIFVYGFVVYKCLS